MSHLGVMFDLDGTLADTLADIAAASNFALAELGHDPLPEHRYRRLAGQGLAYLVRHALGPTHAEQAPEAARLIKAYHAEHLAHRTRLFPGIGDLLDELAARELKLAVLSNKPHDTVCRIASTALSGWPFQAVQGDEPGKPLKPDPAAALAIAYELAIPADHWLYVGDTAADMLTGTGAGMFTVGVTWGFRDEAELREHGADAIIHEPGELLEHVAR